MNLHQALYIIRACRFLELKAHLLRPCEGAMNTFGVLMNGPDCEILVLYFNNGTGPFATDDPNAPKSFRSDMISTDHPRVAQFWILFCPPEEDERILNPWIGKSLLIPGHLFS